ncbi:MAG: 2-hydroxyacid dehydrogenase [Pseudomonadota bacterium]
MTATPHLLLIGTHEPWDLDLIAPRFTVHHLDGGADPASLDEEVRNGITLIGLKGHAPLGGAYMDLFPKLELIANYGVGYDAIDVDAAASRGIAVTNTPDVLSGDVADLAVGMLIAHCRGIVGAEAHARTGAWSDGAFPLQRRMFGKRVGIMGLGRIGHAIALRLAAFEMDISYWSRAPKPGAEAWRHEPDPVALARDADFLVVALAGGAATVGLVNGEMIDALGPDGVLVNISRGSTIDEPAMLNALESGRLGGAALDVFAAEPDFDPRFKALDTVLLQPHQASGTVETRKAMGQLMIDNLIAQAEGRALLTRVN